MIDVYFSLNKDFIFMLTGIIPLKQIDKGVFEEIQDFMVKILGDSQGRSQAVLNGLGYSFDSLPDNCGLL